MNKLYVDIDATTEAFHHKVASALGAVSTFEDGVSRSLLSTKNKFALVGAAVGAVAIGLGRSLARLQEQYSSALMPLQNLTSQNGEYQTTLSFIKSLAESTGQSQLLLAQTYKGVYASAKQAGYATKEINTIFQAVSKSGAALKLGNEQVSLSLKAIEQMMNKGTISSEELRQQLGDHIPGAYALMAKAAQDAGISVTGSTEELGKLLEQGKLASNVVLPFFAKRMEEAFGKDAARNLETISGSANVLKNNLDNLLLSLDSSKVGSFWATFNRGIAAALKDLTTLVNSNEFGLFMSYITGDIVAMTKARAMTNIDTVKEEARKRFAELEKKDRDAIIAKKQEEIRLTKQEADLAKQNNRLALSTAYATKVEKLEKALKIYTDINDKIEEGPLGGGGKIEGTITKIQSLAGELAALKVELIGGDTIAQQIKQVEERYRFEKQEMTDLLKQGKLYKSEYEEWVKLSEQKLQKDLAAIRKGYWADVKEIDAIGLGQTTKDRQMQMVQDLSKMAGIDLSDKGSGLAVTKAKVDKYMEELSSILGTSGRKALEKTREDFNIDGIFNLYGQEAFKLLDELKFTLTDAIGSTFDFVGDTFALAFASAFNPNIDFKASFKQLAAGFLQGLGDLAMNMGKQMLTVAIAKEIAEKSLLAFMGNGIPAALALIGVGAAIKGAGMSMASSPSGVNTNQTFNPGTGNQFGMFGGGGININVNGVLVGEGTQLKAVLNNTSNFYG